MNHETIINFWFEEIESSSWYKKDEAFDAEIRTRYSEIHARAAACELFEWRTSDEGRLAEIIILDQFSRNMFRDTPKAFAQDKLALALAQEAVQSGTFHRLKPPKSTFIIMPYMHSESLTIHKAAMPLFSEPDMPLDYEVAHQKIIERFGRYPHRNSILNRQSTLEEIAFLKEEGSSF